MNDDALSPDLELASAYLDGDVDEVQRAQVEASPELMALVASFRRQQAELRDHSPADPAAREAAVMAALAEFDVLRAPPAAASSAAAANPGNVVPLQRRTRFSRVMLSAAAALLIGGVGVVAINSFGGSSDDDSSGASPAAKEFTDTGAAADTAVGDAGGGAAPQTINAINGAASAVPALDEPQQLLAFAADPAATTAAATETTAAGAAETTADQQTETSRAAATETVAAAVIPPTARGIVPSFGFTCPLEPSQVVVVEITWKGVPAVAVRDTVTGVIQAIDAQCTVLATVEP